MTPQNLQKSSAPSKRGWKWQVRKWGGLLIIVYFAALPIPFIYHWFFHEPPRGIRTFMLWLGIVALIVIWWNIGKAILSAREKKCGKSS
jgi:hypothetical protein